MRHATPDQIERRKKARELAHRVSLMSADERTAFASQFPIIVTVEGRTLSPFNSCLVAMQNPSCTIVGGFRQWIKSGRAVRKGEHGMSIWVPIKHESKDGAESDDETRFMLGTVFDVSQTQEIETGRDEQAETNQDTYEVLA